ncbi:MAG TPA: hypothetical protein VM100_11710 [Longimicrobiales bacterium]|nr:hypothetical protein [Longimicrobiales bacterium]
MPTLREFFTTEATDILAQMQKLIGRLDAGSTDHPELARHAKGLRGSAQMAREDRVYRAAIGLEAASRSVIAGALAWNEEMSTRVRRTLEDIDALVKGGEADEAADERVKRAIDRWRELGIKLPEDEQGSAAAVQQVSDASRQFRQFTAHEVAGIVAEMEVSLETLAAEPRNRDPLKAILRRMRALLGAARLDEVSVVAEALRAVEDLTKVIAKLNAPVKEEWLSVFRSAREVLKTSLEPLQKGEVPGPSPALSKLRVLRQELLDRYGEGEAVATPAPATAAVPAAPPAPTAAPVSAPPTLAVSPDDPAPIQAFFYSGNSALRRALELREQVTSGDKEAVDEVFELIELGIS